MLKDFNNKNQKKQDKFHERKNDYNSSKCVKKRKDARYIF